VITTRRQGRVIVAELGREPANEIGLPMLDALEGLLREVRAELSERTMAESARAGALVLTSGVRRGFCAGADLRELHHENRAAKARGASLAERTAQVGAFLDRIHAVMDGLDALPIPVIAAVHGVVFGGGFELALACDLIVADKTARFAFPELRLGLVPGFGGIPRLRRDVGNAVVRDLLLTGRSLGAERAHAVGLVSQVVAPGQAAAVAVRTAEQTTRFSPLTVAAAKRFAKPDLGAALAEEKRLFLELFRSPVVEAALARFDADASAMPYLPARPEGAP
jgi:enoyl-CoA hydratase/carnithine racemase